MNGFSVIEDFSIEDFNLEGTLLQHDRTGMKILYGVPKKDKDLYFSYCIKTPAMDESGIPHILEHCVLNGSQKYPVQDLVTNLQLRSTATINGVTRNTTTSFYVQTFAEKEYFNLLDVLGDAVFFPLLKRDTFLNEGVRLELDENGHPRLNGVVFNEVSDKEHLDDLALHDGHKVCFKGCIEKMCSGGDPRHIHEATYEKMVNYHKKYYVPANCLLVLCGNIPLESQLEFLEKNLLCKLPSGTCEYIYKDDTVLKKGMKKYFIDEPSKGCGTSYSLIMRFMHKDKNILREDRTRDIFQAILDEYLKNNYYDGKYGLVSSGKDGSSHHSSFSIIIANIKKKEIRKAKKYIFEIIEDCYKKASFVTTAKNFVESVEYAIKNNSGVSEYEDFTFNAVSGWVERNNPCIYIHNKKKLWEEDKECLLSPDFDKKMKAFIKEIYLDCKSKNFIIYKSDDKFYDKFYALLAANAQKLFKKSSVEQILKDSELVNQYKMADTSVDAKKYLPSLDLSDLPSWEIYNKAFIEPIMGKNGPIHFFSSEQAIENKTYVEIRFVADNLSKEEMYDLDEAIFLVDTCGFNDYDSIGGSAAQKALGIYDVERSYEYDDFAVYGKEDFDFVNRSWLKVSFNVVNENLEEGLKLMKDYIYNINKSNKKSLDEYKKGIKRRKENDECDEDAVGGYGHLIQYYNRCDYDINQVRGFNRHTLTAKYADMDSDKLVDYLFGIYEKVIHGEAIVYTYSDRSVAAASRQIVSEFIETLDIYPLTARKSEVQDSWKKAVAKADLSKKYLCSIYNPKESGSLIMTMKGSDYPSKEYAAEQALLTWFDDGILYDITRKQNGAYYYGCGIRNYNSVIWIKTSQDPNPVKNMECIEKALEELPNIEFTKEQTKEIILKIYGNGLGACSAEKKGYTALYYWLIGSSSKYRKERCDNLLALTPEDLHNAAVRIYEASKTARICTITKDRSQLIGNIVWVSGRGDD